MADFDVVVIGGGTAGTRVAHELAWAGRVVALIERDPVGGACVASKSLLHSARRGETWEHAVARRDELTRHRDDAALAEAGVTVLRGTGRVVRPGTVEVDGDEHGYTDLVVCTGGEPVRPALPGLAEVPTWTSDEALGCPDLPRRLVVLGGGPVACELAQVYAAFGSQVTVVDAAPRLLATEAPFVGAVVGDSLHRTGADLCLGVEPDRFEPADVGFRLWSQDGGMIEADRVLVAAERRPRVDDIGLEHLGLEELTVDEACQAAPHVWAAGDVTGGQPGAHTAGYQAGIVAANILGNRREADYRAIPRAVHTTPAAYAVGFSPGAPPGASPGHDDVVVAGLDLSEIARATLEDDDRGRVELYADRSSGVLVGAAAVGLHAEEWMSEVALAIRAEVPLATLADVVRAYPTYGEAIGITVHELLERLAGQQGGEGTHEREQRGAGQPGDSGRRRHGAAPVAT